MAVNRRGGKGGASARFLVASGRAGLVTAGHQQASAYRVRKMRRRHTAKMYGVAAPARVGRHARNRSSMAATASAHQIAARAQGPARVLTDERDGTMPAHRAAAYQAEATERNRENRGRRAPYHGSRQTAGNIAIATGGAWLACIHRASRKIGFAGSAAAPQPILKITARAPSRRFTRNIQHRHLALSGVR